jgi:diguanylate cyclase (GGDEF)-like protein
MAEASTRPAVAVVTGLDEYQLRLLRGMAPVFDAHRTPLVVHANDPFAPGVSSPLLARLLRHGDPAGVITSAANAATEERELLRLLLTLDKPLVRIGADLPDATWVHGDNISGMRSLMGHLLDERGVRRIVLVQGIPHQIDAVERERVFRHEMERRGLPVDEGLVVCGGFSHDQAYTVVRDLLARDRDLDAVVALNDMSAVGALGALSDAGLRVPEEVLVTGFDNDQIAVHWPGLTTVDQRLEEQGRIAAEALVAQMAGAAPRGEVVVPSRLVVRGSTAPRGCPVTEELCSAIDMAKAAQCQLAAQDAVLGVNRVLTRCRTLDEVARARATRLDRMGVRRCYLATVDGMFEDGGHVGSLDRVRLALAYTESGVRYAVGGAYSPTRLLPECLDHELARGMLVLQPLTMIDRELGYVLFEPAAGMTTVAEVLRMDLCRTLDGVASTQELRDHAVTLERLVARRTAELESANVELQRSVLLDGLTRIANRVALGPHLERYWQELVDSGDELAVLMVDVDLFKPFNDRYGHLVGDEALRTVARALQGAVRDGRDLACRYGGEEFALVLPEAGRAEAVAVAERFRALLAEAAVPHQASSVSSVVTASVGVAVARAASAAGPFVVVEAADRALYRAKALGRDRIAVAEPPASTVAEPPASTVADHSVPRQRASVTEDTVLRDC